MGKEDTQFKKGNTIGSETRFQKGNTISKKYKREYAEKLISFFKYSEDFPTIEGFAVENDISIRSVKAWALDEEKYPGFALAYEMAMGMQKTRLMQEGLKYNYNASLVKFLLINNHDMTDKSSNDTKITFNLEYTSPEIDEESN